MLDRPTAKGVRGVCKHCHRRRTYPHTLDFRGFPLSEAAGELGDITS